MSRYSVLLRYKKPNGNGGTKWIQGINASSRSEAIDIAISKAESSEPSFTWTVEKVDQLS
ncbi:hypothetical protein NKT77_07835 [Moraxella sp. FZLJ2107]|uniref:hypothetical protein n=1 Tax=unclassified Moraxella TaxID=2685852 RepID=UPI0020C88F4B|nr:MULTISPECIES: hypothetical protein [unclassified Moraxella]UTO04436.1 hypothetical protein NKT77_07835 [Moraxella sp. FZLJ2107]UTO23269.1 hypothetical protein NKU06_04620 [Moraxella sp. FZLJ2109]